MPAEPILSAYLTSWLTTVRDPIWAAGLGSVQNLKSGGAIPDARKTDKFAKYHLVMHSKRIKSDFERKKSGMKIFYKTRRCFFRAAGSLTLDVRNARKYLLLDPSW